MFGIILFAPLPVSIIYFGLSSLLLGPFYLSAVHWLPTTGLFFLRYDVQIKKTWTTRALPGFEIRTHPNSVAHFDFANQPTNAPDILWIQVTAKSPRGSHFEHDNRYMSAQRRIQIHRPRTHTDHAHTHTHTQSQNTSTITWNHRLEIVTRTQALFCI